MQYTNPIDAAYLEHPFVSSQAVPLLQTWNKNQQFVPHTPDVLTKLTRNFVNRSFHLLVNLDILGQKKHWSDHRWSDHFQGYPSLGKLRVLHKPADHGVQSTVFWMQEVLAASHFPHDECMNAWQILLEMFRDIVLEFHLLWRFSTLYLGKFIIYRYIYILTVDLYVVPTGYFKPALLDHLEKSQVRFGSSVVPLSFPIKRLM